MTKSATTMVSEAKGRVENLGAEEARLELGYGAFFIDLREAEEVARDGSIPGALHVPRGMLEFVADPATPYHNPVFKPDARLILYCAAGARSALAAATLQEMGFRKVAHLECGFAGWREAGYAVDRPRPA